MRLKSLEIIGFKSFADKTRLDFLPGMTAIVGPNGCGKSNISDAVRWVIGEQSAKVLRGARMEDCIFNGTDDRKPLGMAEVSLTLGDCEAALGTEFHEVTITRRVFRTGEGQYFMNKTPCRLKDIQRAFMDTGIGASSYSLMEQGKIDQILSSRPEDRREIFEEASGITRFKADKKEAIQKLEHTDANLLRLADVIREVKRQIGSLQRQAGKARRYKEYRDQLRRLDVFATRKRLQAFDDDLRRLTEETASLDAQVRSAADHVAGLEDQAATAREALLRAEHEISGAAESGARAESKLEHSRELIRVNTERIAEYRRFSERDAREIAESRQQIEKKRTELADVAARLETTRADHATARERLHAADHAFQEHDQKTAAARAALQRAREEAIEVESALSRLQNQLVELDSRDRSKAFQRERLAVERSQITRLVASFDKRQEEMNAALAALRLEVAGLAKTADNIRRRLVERTDRTRALQQELADIQVRRAAREAEARFFREDGSEARAGGARSLLESAGPDLPERDRILGEIASFLNIPAELRPAVTAALRAWLDAVLIRDSAAARRVLRRIEARRPGAVRLLALDAPAPAPPALPANVGRLLDRLTIPADVRPAFERLLGHVVLAESLDAIPSPVPPGLAYVTPAGSLVHADGAFEFWMPEPGVGDLLSRRQRLADAEVEVAGLLQDVQARHAEMRGLSADTAAAEQALEQARLAADQAGNGLAHKEGEAQVIAREATEARRRLETVTWELESLNDQAQSGSSERDKLVAQKNEIAGRRDRLSAKLAESAGALQDLEQRHGVPQAEATESRVRFTQAAHQVERLQNERNYAQARIEELETSIGGRAANLQSYETSIAEMRKSIQTAQDQMGSLEEEVRRRHAGVQHLRQACERQSADLKVVEGALSQARAALDAGRKTRSDLDLQMTENKMRRQNQSDRLTSEYGDSLDKLMAEPAPEFPAGELPSEALETSIAELRTKIEAMGAVNLVAIEELRELEERHTFLTGQEGDLVNARQQLMNMIRQINRTTSEMFRTTFDRINENFQNMFKKLFNGGTAKLVLVNEEDVLECGIEIIARPPGKRLQNVSLLSGGERTLTAVALLFGIYMTKPSPFCVLDELDAALDESNINRFVNALRESLRESQFIVITHNRQTIEAAGALYGVTMPEKGVSTIMSMKFKDIEDDPGRMQVSGGPAAASPSLPVEPPLESPAVPAPQAPVPAEAPPATS
ncbi:MAG: chromosome segregation protein SMC [Verrucomicrobiota bacterium]|nr:chromosome segregation protein SMC [Verrucomicrobiota bacterium]